MPNPNTAANAFQLKDKSILITGASSGIGRQCAIHCSQLGARVFLLGRNEDRLAETRNQLANPDLHSCFSVDLVNHKLLEQIVNRELSVIHGLINCAGISTTLPLRTVSYEKMDHFFRTNVHGAINLTKVVTKKVHAAKTGMSVVFITSVMAIVGESGKSLYGMTKGALLAAARSLAVELAPRKIRVNCISPGVVNTPMSRDAVYRKDDTSLNRIKGLHPLGLGEPEDVANACVFLLSDAAKWITGSNLVVDGGYTAR